MNLVKFKIEAYVGDELRCAKSVESFALPRVGDHYRIAGDATQYKVDHVVFRETGLTSAVLPYVILK